MGQFVGHDRSHPLLKREVDFATLAAELTCQQRSYAGRRAQNPCHQFAERSVGGERRFLCRVLHAVGNSGRTESQPTGRHPRQLVAHVGAVRPRQAEGRDGGDYQAGIEMLESLAAQALPLNLTALPADDHNVGTGHQLLERIPLGRLLQVQPRAALVGVQIKEHPAPVRVGLAVGEGAVPPVTVALGRFHLHHVGSGVAEQTGAEGRRRHPGVLHDPHAGERRRRGHACVCVSAHWGRPQRSEADAV